MEHPLTVAPKPNRGLAKVFSAIAALVVVVYPGLHTWWKSRRLLDHLDDPLLPDLLWKRTQSASWTLAVALGVGLVTAGPYLGLLLGGALAGVLIGAFPARRRIFDESWSLGAYLSHVARFYLGNFGALLLLALLPQVLRAAGAWAGVAGLLAGTAILGYGLFASRVLPRVLRAKPLERPELEASFSRILGAARTRRPRILEADAPGGSWVNAFALPSVRHPAVVLTRGLLDALDADETAAIFAHEVAHLEHYHPKRLWLSRVVTLFLVALVVFLWAGPYASWLRGFEWVWTVALALAVTGRAGHASRHEAESDLRAVELCGDPEALVRGLTKLHALGRIPRRFSEWTEKHATHPSLARRIQSIRAATKAKRALELEPRLFAARDGSGRGVVLDSERLHWLSRIPAGSEDPLSEAAERRSLRYEELRELRIDAAGTERALVLMEVSGSTARMPVDPVEAPRLQETLDAIDGQIGYRAPEPSPAFARLVSLALMLLSLLTQTWALTAVAALAVFAPTAATLAALGASGTLTSLLAVVRSQATPVAPTLVTTVAVALASIACLVCAIRSRRERSSSSRVVTALAVLVPLGVTALALPGGVHVVTSSLPLMHAHLWSRSHPSMALGLVAVAAALATLRSRQARLGAGLAAAAAAVVLAAGSRPARESFADDVFRSPGRPLPAIEARLDALRELDVPGAVFSLALSPRGDRIAAGTYRAESDPDEERAELDFYVETRSGELERIPALALEWWDDDRVLLVALKEEQAALRLVRLDGGIVEDEVPLVPLLEIGLRAAPAAGGFEVQGRTPDESELVVTRGSFERGTRETLRFGYDPATGTTPDVVSSQGVGLEIDYRLPQVDSPLGSWYPPDAFRYLVRRMGLRPPGSTPDWVGATTLDVDCRPQAEPGRGFACVVGEDERTSFWSLDPRTGRWTSLGAYGERLYRAPGSAGEIVLLGGSEGPVLAELDRDRVIATRLPRPDGSGPEVSPLAILLRWEPAVYLVAAAWSAETVAVASPWDPRIETSRVTLYELR